MLYVASVRHKANECPGSDPDLMNEVAKKLSSENLAKKNMKILDAFVDQSCFFQEPKSADNSDHVCTFVMDVPSPSLVAELFAPFPVESTPSVKWQDKQV